MLAVEKIYVAHYSPLEERKNNLLKLLNENNLQAKWIEEEPLEKERLNLVDISIWDAKFLEMNSINYSPSRQLKTSEFSLCYKHLKIYEDIIKNNIKTSLILEDDVLFCDNFIKLFNLNMFLTPKDWDFIFIGNGCNLKIPDSSLEKGKVAYKKEHPASRCTDSYVVKYSAVKKILKTLLPFTFPIDFELNYQMFKHNMNVYWWEPSVINQGSQNGLFKSHIQG